MYVSCESLTKTLLTSMQPLSTKRFGSCSGSDHRRYLCYRFWWACWKQQLLSSTVRCHTGGRWRRSHDLPWCVDIITGNAQYLTRSRAQSILPTLEPSHCQHQHFIIAKTVVYLFYTAANAELGWIVLVNRVLIWHLLNLTWNSITVHWTLDAVAYSKTKKRRSRKILWNQIKPVRLDMKWDTLNALPRWGEWSWGCVCRKGWTLEGCCIINAWDMQFIIL